MKIANEDMKCCNNHHKHVCMPTNKIIWAGAIGGIMVIAFACICTCMKKGKMKKCIEDSMQDSMDEVKDEY